MIGNVSVVRSKYDFHVPKTFPWFKVIDVRDNHKKWLSLHRWPSLIDARHRQRLEFELEIISGGF